MARLGGMTAREIRQLRDNALGLDQPAVAELCTEALKGRSEARVQTRGRWAPRTQARHLVARSKAFQARGVYLADPRSDWGGVRRDDGAVVFALWADTVVSSEGTCRYLLWAANVDGRRPWSEKPAGLARLEHCQRALDNGRAEGLLAYGQALEGYIPEDKAHTIYGIDADVVLELQVQRRGDEYWALWGKRTRSVAASL
jgi:hypothetical protein